MDIKRILRCFSLSVHYTEKSAIRGHSVDRYNYALQLINEGSDVALIKAYAWLNLAAQEKDREKPAKLLMYQLSFELKTRGIFEKATDICKQYHDQYSAEAFLKKIHASKNPIYYLLRALICVFHFFNDQIEFFDKNIIKKRGSAFLWGCIGAVSSILSALALFHWTNHPDYLHSIFLVTTLFSIALSASIWEAREESESEEH